MAPLRHTPRTFRHTPVRVIVLAFALLSVPFGRGPTYHTSALAADPPASKDEAFTQHLRPILQKHCFACHSDKKAKADLRLDMLASDFQAAETIVAWEKVERQLAAHSMPPSTKPQPSAEEVKALRTWIDGGLVRTDAARQRKEGRAIVRRMSRVEYVNTIRDLLGVDVELKELLPEDLPAPDGFENDGLALRVSSVLIERYMEAADIALKAALVHGPRPVSTKVKLSYKNERLFKLAMQEGTVAELDDAVVLLGQRTLGLEQFKSKAAGEYRFRISAYTHQNKGQPMVLAVHSHSLDAGASGERALGHYAVQPDKPAIIEFVVKLQANTRVNFHPDGLVKSRGKGPHPGIAVEWIEVEGPLGDVWPPDSYQRLLGKVDAKTAKLADAEKALRHLHSQGAPPARFR